MNQIFSPQFSKLIIVSLIISCLLTVSAIAAANQQQSKSKLQAKLQQLHSFQADFSQKVVDIDNTVLQQAEGTISLLQPNKLYWELLPPNDNILLADGETLWNIDSFMQQVVAYNQTSAIENNPLILLTDPNSEKWQEFMVTASENEFVISPVTQTGSVEILRLVFDSNNRLIQLETTDVQKQTSTLYFSNISQNKTLVADKFVFTMPDGYDLDDQRAQ